MPTCLEMVSGAGSGSQSSHVSEVTVIPAPVRPTPALVLPPASTFAAAPAPPVRFVLGPTNRARSQQLLNDGSEGWWAYVIHLFVVAVANCSDQ